MGIFAEKLSFGKRVLPPPLNFVTVHFSQKLQNIGDKCVSYT